MRHDTNPEGKVSWAVQGIGPIAVLRDQTTNVVKILMKKVPNGGVAINTRLLPMMKYEQIKKRARFPIADAEGHMKTWLVQFADEEEAKAFAKACEENKA